MLLRQDDGDHHLLLRERHAILAASMLLRQNDGDHRSPISAPLTCENTPRREWWFRSWIHETKHSSLWSWKGAVTCARALAQGAVSESPLAREPRDLAAASPVAPQSL